MGFFNFKTASDRENKEVDGGAVLLRGHSLVIGNEIYQIRNISTISVMDLSVERPVPKWCPVVTISGIVALIAAPEDLKFLGGVAVLVGVVGWIYYTATKIINRYGLSVLMNAGNRLVLLSGELKFLKGMALALNDAISEERSPNITFNLDQKQIFDNNSNCVISTGSVTGDIVNEIK